MVTRAGRCCGAAFARTVGRSALGVLVAALAALAVLVHHDSTAMADHHDTSRTSMAAMTEPRADRLVPESKAPHSGAVGSSAHHDAPAGHADNAMNCGAGVPQHCGAVSAEGSKLSPPKETFRTRAATHPVPRHTPAAPCSTERAPPELSALSQLRI